MYVVFILLITYEAGKYDYGYDDDDDHHVSFEVYARV
jgi:hypothetical protein